MTDNTTQGSFPAGTAPSGTGQVTKTAAAVSSPPAAAADSSPAPRAGEGTTPSPANRATAPSVSFDEFLELLDGARDAGSGWVALCPAHDDRKPSLSIGEGEGSRVVVHCHAGCSTEDILDALDLTMRDLARMRVNGENATPSPARQNRAASRPTAPKGKKSKEPERPVSAESARDALFSVKRWHEATHSYPGFMAIRYATERFGTNRHLADRFMLGYAPKMMRSDRLCIPFWIPGTDGQLEVVGYQARALDSAKEPKWTTPKNPSAEKGGGSWPRHLILDGRDPLGEGATDTPTQLLICEGPGDTLTAASAGYAAAGFRGASTPSHAAVMEIVAWAASHGLEEAIVLGDGDESGQKYAASIAGSLAEIGFPYRVAALEPGTDVTDIRAADPAGFPAALEALTSTAEGAPPVSPVVSVDPGSLDGTDREGAELLRDHMESLGTPVLHCGPLGGFLVYSAASGVWQLDRGEARLTRVAHAIGDHFQTRAADLRRELSAAPETDKTLIAELAQSAEQARRIARRFHTTRDVRNMLTALRAETDTPAEAFDGPGTRDKIVVSNGIVDLRSGSLHPHDPRLKATRGLDIDYDPAAPAPRFQQFLREVFPDSKDERTGRILAVGAELALYLQVLIGLALTGFTEQIAVILKGEQANGKSVLLTVLEALLGPFSGRIPFRALAARAYTSDPESPTPALDGLRGKRLVMASEIESGTTMSAETLKAITGGEKLSTRGLHRDPSTWLPQFLILIATNFFPMPRDAGDPALWRRLKVVPFMRVFRDHERDTRLEDKLLAELPGILAWAVQGTVRYFAEGLVEPAAVTVASNTYRETANPLYGFLPGVYEITGNQNDRVGTTELWKQVLRWIADERDPGLLRLKKQSFFKMVETLGCPRRKSSTEFFIGIRLAESGATVEADDPDDLF